MDTLRAWVLLVLSSVAFTGVLSSIIVKRDIEYTDGGCGSYRYCEGESFPRRVKVNDWAVSCEDGITNDTLRDNCCLPQEYHLVCYGIKVEGQRLNYANETEDMLSSTDFTDLCHHMVAELGRTPGRYSTGNIIPGEGQIAFRYGDFKQVTPSDKYIVHLACGVEN